MQIEIKNLSFSYDKKVDVIKNLNLNVNNGEIMALVGVSGSGKSTLFKLISGFETPGSGEIMIGGNVVYNHCTNIPPSKRKLGILFQEYALFPHLKMESNIAFGIQHLPKKERKEKVDYLIDLVGLNEQRKHYPSQLSGGQQQRVALARALAIEPDLLLLDEPFSSLDNHNIKKLKSELKEVLQKTGYTAIIISHRSSDTTEFADQISVLKDGCIFQTLTWQDVSGMPPSSYVKHLLEIG